MCLFLGTSALFTFCQRRITHSMITTSRRRRVHSKGKRVSFRSPLTTPSVQLPKEHIMQLRRKRCCKSVTVSYSNTGGLYMVGVSCFSNTPSHNSSSLLSMAFVCNPCSLFCFHYISTHSIIIIQGKGSKMFDEMGNSYLDTRNNVAHCGHGHPHIVQAVQQQVATLNTNTRYLHQNVVVLADRLVQLLPNPLEVVFFVNSGSEANDLALRLLIANRYYN